MEDHSKNGTESRGTLRDFKDTVLIVVSCSGLGTVPGLGCLRYDYYLDASNEIANRGLLQSSWLLNSASIL